MALNVESDNEIKGIGFPFRINPDTGGVEWKTGRAKINQNIRLILGTREGERPMKSTFGTKIASLVHEPNDEVMKDIILNAARQAVLQWEHRAVIADAQIRQQEHELTLWLSYIFTDNSGAGEFEMPLR